VSIQAAKGRSWRDLPRPGPDRTRTKRAPAVAGGRREPKGGGYTSQELCLAKFSFASFDDLMSDMSAAYASCKKDAPQGVISNSKIFCCPLPHRETIGF
jgi:hypothetical protein